VFTLFTFGDSVLDCAHYNSYGVTPGALLVKNEDGLFPEFKGQDLSARFPARLSHHAQDGGTVESLPGQLRGIRHEEGAALVSVGGNDLLRGLLTDPGPGLTAFGEQLTAFLDALPVRPVLLANVYDPTLGDDSRNFTALPVQRARTRHQEMNGLLDSIAPRYGTLVDLHTHFLTGDASWFTSTIEPSLKGASEVRRCFWAALVGPMPPRGTK
jgi:hypothetical protein